MRFILTLLLTLSFSLSALSQGFPDGKPTAEEWQMVKYDKDTAAHAVVLREYGTAQITTAETLPVVFDYHVRIKILDDKGFGSADASILIYHADNDIERIRLIQGTTFYKDKSGKIIKTSLKDDQINRVKVNEHYDRVSFTLPNLRAGCIIEYSYETETPLHDKFHTWNFQSEIPKIRSQYETTIPAMIEYKVALRGPLQITSKKTISQPQSFKFIDFTADCVNTVYTMNDIPAFIAEEGMTSIENYRSAMYFEVLAGANEDNFVQKITKDWKDVDNTLRYDENFGQQIEHLSFIKKALPGYLFSIPDTLARAKAIYQYLQTNLKWNNFISIVTRKGIEKTIDEKKGNTGDINITLITALVAAGINADAVLLSTREHGEINKLYPVITSFNYVVARVTIGGQSYMLDATDPLLSFGMLRLECINDQGRVFNMNKPSYWMNMEQLEKRTMASTVNLALQTDGKIVGTITSYSLGYAAYEKRQDIKLLGINNYVDSVRKKYPFLQLVKADIQNVDSLDAPIIETFDIAITELNPFRKDEITLDPAFWEQLLNNPCKQNTRSYPIDLGFASKNTVSVILSYPDNYVVTNQPLPDSMTIPNNGAAYVSSLTIDPGIIKYSEVTKINKAVYQPSEYLYLKEFYNKIIQSQKTSIIFKKKS